MRQNKGWVILIAVLTIGTPALTYVGAAQAAVQPSPPGAVHTVQDALDEMERSNAGAAHGKAHGPMGDPHEWYGADAYPAEALRRGEQGRTVAEVQIDDTGKLIACTVTSSSGSASLDQTTCAIALQDRHYSPATDRKGRPIVSHATLAIRWVLPIGQQFGQPVDVTVQPPPTRTLEMTVTVAGDGTLEGCHAELTGRKPGETGDPCDSLKVGSKVSAGFRRNGHPVGARIVTHWSEQALIDP